MLFGDARKVEMPQKRVCVQESGGGGIDLPPLSAATSLGSLGNVTAISHICS